MRLHPLAEQFASVAGAYEAGRPDYAPAVVGALAAELELDSHAAVLDLAAGTGKLTRALLHAGLDVVAVEPQAPLRDLLADSVGAERVRDGTAEAIPLADASVQAVTVADAFHWFDQPAALAEIRRVTRPGGGLAVLTTVPDWRGTSWAQAVGEVMRRARPQHPHFDGPPWQEAVRAAGGWREPREIRVTTSQPTSPDVILQYLASVSWIAALSGAERTDTLARLARLVSTGETPAELPIHVTIGISTLGSDSVRPIEAQAGRARGE